MGVQLTDNAEALRLFFTDDIYLVAGESEVGATIAVAEPITVVDQEVSTAPATPVAAAIDAVESKPAEAREFKYLGKNQKNVLILVNDETHDVSTERGRELLRNIVKAIQLSANDFALVNYSGYGNTPLSEFTGFFSSRLVLVFGVVPAVLRLKDYPQNMLVREEGVQLVFSANLDLLAADQNGKKTLWGSLKQLSI